MKLLTALIVSMVMAGTAYAKEETKDVKANGKTMEVRVPKSAKIDCKVAENKDKTECKKASKEIPKIEKPKETAPADAKKGEVKKPATPDTKKTDKK
jgi:hypothetical protein